MNQILKSSYIYIIYIIVFFFIFNTSSLPQSFQYKNYSEQDNLSHIEAYSLYQDSKGYLWIGTKVALNRFDGVEFRRFTTKDGLLDNYIFAIQEDHRGNMWFATEKGLSCYSSGKFKNYTTAQGLADNYARSLAEDHMGNIWIGTSNGLCCFRDNHFRTFTQTDGLISNKINALWVDKIGKLWIGQEKGISCYTRNRFINYSTENGLISNRVICIFSDSSEKLWIGTDRGVSYFTGTVFTSYPVQTQETPQFVNTIREDNNGNYFWGTREGLTIISKNIPFYGHHHGLTSDLIYSLLKDNEGNIWIASYDGVTCLKSMDILTFSKKDGLSSNYINTILEDQKDGYWIGTSGGLDYYTSNTIKSYTTRDGLIGNQVLALLQDRNQTLWIGTLRGLSVYSSGKFKNYSTENGLADNFILSLCEVHDGTVWIGTRNGIQLFRNNAFWPPPFELSDHVVESIIQDSNRDIWFSSDEGIYRYSFATGKLKRFSMGDSLIDNSINFIFEDKHKQIWIGSEKGLIQSINGKVKIITTADGLPDNVCKFATEDHRGYLWIGTDNGLSCFNGKTFETFNIHKNGLIANIWTCGIKDRKGKLWLGSPHGINTFIPPLKTNPIPPPVHITSVTVMGRDVPLTGSQEFKYNRNNFKFSFTGICLTEPESVTYKFQLKGMDSHWNDTKQRSVFYPYLPPGNYTFRVKAYNNDGIESRQPAEYSFKIDLPFWKTGWFITLVFLLVLTGTVVVHRFYYNWTEDKKRLKERTQQLMMSQRMELLGTLAAGAVHDMQNLLTIIIGYSSINKKDESVHDKNHQLLFNIKDAATAAVQLVKQILKFSRQKINDTATAFDMVSMLNENLELINIMIPKQIRLIWIPPKEKMMLVITPIQFQQIVMNLCINAVHAMPNGVTLTVTLSKEADQTFVLEISDTGCGMNMEVLNKIFEPLFTTKKDGKGTGLGLFVVQQLVKEYNGTISVRSIPGSGTTFTIRFSGEQ